jgi:HSP20 family molecular chaperone IbpA
MREHAEELEAFADELIESALVERPSWDLQSCCLEPLCSVFVSVDEVVVTVDLPNIDPKNIKVEAVEEDLIETTAKMKKKLHFEDFGITHRQGEFSAFRCQTRIPVPVNIKQMKTQFKRGILEIHLPRKKGYRIRIE